MQRGQWLVWRERFIYLLTSTILVLAGLVPLGSDWPLAAFPDLIYCLTIGWVMRRPDSAPVWLVAIIGFGSDILLGRPLGLWSLLLVLGAEYFRGRETGKGVQMRLFEWLSVALLFATMLLIYKLLLTIAFAPAPTYSAVGWHALATGLAYPPVVAVLYWVLKIRAPLPADRSRSIGRVA